MEDVICKLCSETIREPEDSWCFGCKSYICENHLFDPWGNHDVEDHDFVQEEIE